MADRHYLIGVWNDLLTPRHKKILGESLWYLCWLVDKVTEQREDQAGQTRGMVLGGSLIQARQLAAALGDSEATVNRHLRLLETAGYIERHQRPYGHTIEVIYAKWRPRDSLRPDTSGSSDHEVARVGDMESLRHDNFAHSHSLTLSNPRELSIKDNAVPEDKQEMHDDDDRTRASPESEKIWSAIMAYVQGQMSRPGAEAAQRCQAAVNGNTITVYALPDDQRVLDRWVSVLRMAAKAVTARQMEVQIEARAGPP